MKVLLIMSYNEVTTQEGKLITRRIQHTPTIKTISFKKGTIRKEIQKDIFDLEDSVADNAKMISLLITLSSRIYNILDTVQKDKLTTTDRSMIEYIFTKFDTVNTRADIQFATEGIVMLDKLLDRQGAIGTIVSKY